MTAKATSGHGAVSVPLKRAIRPTVVATMTLLVSMMMAQRI
jgi:hypothetical protein